MRKNLGGGEENHLDRNDVGRESGDVQVLFLISLNFSTCLYFYTFHLSLLYILVFTEQIMF